MTLTEFLLARIQEDELTAQAAIAREPNWGVYYGDQVHDDAGVVMVPASSVEVADHIARHDPARVLGECAARTRIVELHLSGEAWCDHCEPPNGHPDTCPTLTALALPYAEHLDYLDEWRP